MTFADLHIDLRGNTAGQIKTKCPWCSHKRKQHKNEPCLSVNIEEGIYNCHHCGIQGSIHKAQYNQKSKKYVLPQYNQTKLDDKVVQWLKGRGISQSTLVKNRVTEEKTFIQKSKKEMNCIVFNYFRGETLVNKKYRSADKGFKLVSGAELIFYNLNNVGNETIITEGELDALSFDEAGFPNAISVPNGASKGNNNLQYLDNCWNELKDVKTVYLAMDADANGQSLMKELGRRIGYERCLMVKYPEDCNDPNAVLMKLGYEALKDCIKKAEPFPLEGVITTMEVRDDVFRLYDKGAERGDDIDLGEFGRLCTFKTSLLYVITGIPSHGKSTFLNWVEVRLASMFGWKFAVFSPEHYPLEYMIYKYAELIVGMPFFEGVNQRMSKSALADAIKFVHEHFFFIRPEGELFTLDKIMEAGRQLVGRYGVKGFTIDPWNMIAHEFKGMSETQYIERALNKLTIFKQVNDIAVFLVAHPNKMLKVRDGGEKQGLYEVPSLYDISQSSHFYNKADFGLSIYRNFNSGFTEVYCQKVKFKNLGEIDWMQFQYDKLTNRYAPQGASVSTDNLAPQNAQGELPLEIKPRLPYADDDSDDDLVFADIGDAEDMPF